MVLPQPKFQLVSHACVLVHVALGPTLVLFNCYLWRCSASTLIQTEARVMVGDMLHLLLVQTHWDLHGAPQQSALQ
jgi:hypothetical protein